MTSPLATAAADYLNRGLRVIALTGKTPNVRVHRNGIYTAIEGPVESDEDWSLLAAAFEHEDTTGVGIVIGYPYVVVDIDGEEGAEQWRDLTGQTVPDITPVATTGRGMHIWYSSFTPTGTIKLGAKLDLKAEGGYVAAPPSVHPSGAIYEWLNGFEVGAPMELPPGIQKLVDYHAAQKARRIGGRDQRRAIPVTVKLGGVVYTSVPSFDGIIKKLAEAEEGNRNNMLHWAAATIAEEGGQSEDFEALAEAALAVGLEREETRRTIRSAGRLGE